MSEPRIAIAEAFGYIIGDLGSVRATSASEYGWYVSIWLRNPTTIYGASNDNRERAQSEPLIPAHSSSRVVSVSREAQSGSLGTPTESKR